MTLRRTTHIIQVMNKNPKTPTGLENVIRDAIMATGLTHGEFAKISGVPQPTISRFLDADPMKRRTITLPVADRLCKTLGLRLVKATGKKKRKG